LFRDEVSQALFGVRNISSIDTFHRPNTDPIRV
jgi:hypothetical protein